MKFLLPLVIPVAFVTIWCAVCFLIAASSGWRKLAQSFGATHTPQGQKFWMQNALINAVRFNGAITFIVGPEGLYIKIMPLFSLFGTIAPPLLIPWSELSPLQRSNGGRLLRFEMWSTTISRGSQRVEIILLSRTLAQAIASFQPGIHV